MLPYPKGKRQQSVNSFWFCIFDSQRAMQPLQPISIVSAAFVGHNARYNIATISS